ncbi:hypothetical protein KY285_020938 [Solanum tuberosum]|nr:hypothetical protein KY285_020938 [Solanum tuberosum]
MQSSSPELPISRRFFKVMVPGFHSKLTIPPAFFPKLKGDKSEKGTIIKGKDTWNVEINRSEKGVISFDKGWEEFVQNHDLRVGDFAVFEHLGNMSFSVTLLDSTGCDKKLLEKSEVVPSQEKKKKVKSGQSGIEKRKLEGDQPHYQCMKGSSEFTARIKEYNVRKRSPYMHIPTEFCQSNALFQNTTMTLTGPSGKSCPVSLRICNGGKTLYACITRGWHDFFSSNKLKVGDVCIFQLDRSKSDSNSIAIDPARLWFSRAARGVALGIDRVKFEGVIQIHRPLLFGINEFQVQVPVHPSSFQTKVSISSECNCYAASWLDAWNRGLVVPASAAMQWKGTSLN